MDTGIGERLHESLGREVEANGKIIEERLETGGVGACTACIACLQYCDCVLYCQLSRVGVTLVHTVTVHIVSVLLLDRGRRMKRIVLYTVEWGDGQVNNGEC